MAQDERGKSSPPPPPLFTTAANVVLAECKALYDQRNEEYSDSLADGNLVKIFSTATLKHLTKKNIDLTSDAGMRVIQLASIIDVKLSRMQGGYKADTSRDSINYEAVWAYCMEQL